MRRRAASERPTYRRGLTVSVINFGALAVFGVVSSVIIARIYGVEVIGENALTLAPALAMTFLSSAREQTGLVRKLAVLPPRHPHVTGLWAAVFGFSVLLTLVVGLLVGLGAWWVLSGPVGRPDLVPAALVQLAGYVVITNTCWNLDMVLSSFRAAESLFGAQVSQALAYLAVAVTLGLTVGGLWGLVAATLAMWTAGLVYRIPSCLRYMQARVGRADLRHGLSELPAIIRFGIRLAPGGIVDGVNNQAGVWVLGALAPVSSVGAYDRAMTLARRFYELSNRITEVLLPTLVERRADGDHEGMTRSLVDTTRYVAVAMMLVASVGGGASLGIMNLFGPGFEQGRWVLALGLLAMAFGIVTLVLEVGVLAMDRPGLVSWVAISRMLITMAVIVPLTLALDLTGTALAGVAGEAVALTWLTIWTLRSLESPAAHMLRGREGVALLVATGVGFGTAFALDVSLPQPWGVLLALTGGGGAYLIAYVGLGGIGPRERERIGGLVAAVRSRREGAEATPASSSNAAPSSSAGGDSTGTSA